MSRQTKYVIGMIASILTACAGAAKLVDAPYDDLLTIGGVIGTAITAYQADRRKHRSQPRQRPPKRL